MSTNLATRFVNAVVVAEGCASTTGAGRSTIADILAEVDASDGGAGALIDNLLSAYDHAAHRIYTEGVGMMGLRVALAELARTDPDMNRRQAADLILAFSMWHVNGDSAFRAVGADVLDQVGAILEQSGIWHQIAEAVVSVWGELMPTVHVEGGAQLEFG